MTTFSGVPPAFIRLRNAWPELVAIMPLYDLGTDSLSTGRSASIISARTDMGEWYYWRCRHLM